MIPLIIPKGFSVNLQLNSIASLFDRPRYHSHKDQVGKQKKEIVHAARVNMKLPPLLLFNMWGILFNELFMFETLYSFISCSALYTYGVSFTILSYCSPHSI